jgi:predicted GNAT family N-acyltransferase
VIAEADFHVEPASWLGEDQADLRHVREQVFIVEQQCPEEEEWDALDERSRHVLARDRDGRPIGTGRLTPEHKIGRMAVLAPWRGRGVGDAILRVLLEQARALRLPAVEMHAQTHAIPFYARLGFAAYGEEFLECGIAHRRMRLELEPLPAPAPRPLPPRPEARELAADDRAQMLAALAALLGDAEHELAILTRDLDAELFATPASLEALKRIALSGRRARIRILVQDPRAARTEALPLITLAQRLPSAFALRTPVEDIDSQLASAFVLNDRRGYLFRPLATRFEAEGSTYAPGRHAQLLASFEQIWERSEPAVELRALGI